MSRLKEIARLLAVALLVANVPLGSLGAGAVAPAHASPRDAGDGDQHPLVGQVEAATGRPALSARRAPFDPGRRAPSLGLTAHALPSVVRAHARATFEDAFTGGARLLRDVHASRGPPLG